MNPIKPSGLRIFLLTAVGETEASRNNLSRHLTNDRVKWELRRFYIKDPMNPNEEERTTLTWGGGWSKGILRLLERWVFSCWGGFPNN